MDPVAVKIPPGMFRNGTEYESAGRWYDGNLVRWENGRIRPIGGWRRVLAGGAALTGKARAILGWRGNNGFRYAAIGTNEKLYISSGSNYADLTPSGLVPGRPDGIAGPGFGVGPYGAEHYGRRRATNVLALDAATWSMDTWGENWVGVLSSDGRIFQWAPTGGAIPAPITNAPVNCVGVLVTNEEFLVALGPAGNRRKAQWCSQADNTTWTPSDLNTAGSRNLKTTGNIVTGRLVGEQPVIWTNNDVHVLDYLGFPSVYGNRRLPANGCGLISANGVVIDGGTALWMSKRSFFQYDGTVRPLPCEVADYVFKDFNVLQASKVFAGFNSITKEAIWFYPSSTSLENDRYVMLNRADPQRPAWYFGMMPRTCWLDNEVFQYPLAVDPDGVIYEHEYGFLADGATRSVFAQSGPAEIGDGKKIIYSNLMLPDVSGAENLQFRMKTRTAPMGPESSYGPYPYTPNAEGYVPVRIQGRQAAMRIEQIADADWSRGTDRFMVGQGGSR